MEGLQQMGTYDCSGDPEVQQMGFGWEVFKPLLRRCFNHFGPLGVGITTSLKGFLRVWQWVKKMPSLGDHRF